MSSCAPQVKVLLDAARVFARASSPAKVRATQEIFARYLPAAGQDEAWGLQVTNAGYVKIEPMAHAPAGHPQEYALPWSLGMKLQEYQLHYFPKVGGVFESKPSGRCEIQGGDFFLLFPGVWHRYSPLPTNGWDQYWVGFKGPYIDQLVHKGAITPAHPVVHPDIRLEVLTQYRELIAELQAESPESMPVLAAITMLLLARALAAHKDKNQRTERIIRSAQCILRSNLERDIDLHTLASSLNTSYTWLRRSFQLYTGQSLHQYRLQLRIQKASQLLASSDCTVREAAWQIGFNDEFYFSRLFKLKTGHSPEALKHCRKSTAKLSPVS